MLEHAAWRLLAEFTLPIDHDAPDRAVAIIMSAVAALDLPEARLKQVRQLIADAILNRVSGNTCTVRLFVAQPIGDQPHAPAPSRGWGLFSIQKAEESDGSTLVLEIYFYIELRQR